MSNTNNRELYPEIHPYKESFITGDDTHEIFIEESGNPDGQPVLFLHGGPGGGTGAKQRRFFDPSHYRIILFDQRGCGKSKPLGETEKNTTDNLVNDIELIRKELNIKAWILFGGSWGSTLALAYSIKYPVPPEAVNFDRIYKIISFDKTPFCNSPSIVILIRFGFCKSRH